MITTINRAIAAKRAGLDENEKQKGFTLIELLVVVLIIGILAAIAIPAFLNQRQGAWESAVKSDIGNAAIAAETYAAAHNGSYVGLTLTNTVVNATGAVTAAASGTLVSSGYNQSPEVRITVTASASAYTLVATHVAYGSATWTYSSASGATVRS